ncbi:beta-1,6 glucan synthetase [Peziza echinospora]|nr:beta-1,6 glucan synthetase [Peziza echinospora]
MDPLQAPHQGSNGSSVVSTAAPSRTTSPSPLTGDASHGISSSEASSNSTSPLNSLPQAHPGPRFSRSSLWTVASAQSEANSTRPLFVPSARDLGVFADPRGNSSTHLISPQPLQFDGTTANANFQTQFTPHPGLILYPSEVEADDDIHNPEKVEPEEKKRTAIWTTRGMLNLGALCFMSVALIFMFIGYPIYLYAGKLGLDTTEVIPNELCENSGLDCKDVQEVDKLKNARSGLIDPETPQAAHSKKSTSGKDWVLVFSDEFNVENRTFYPGDDPFWEAVDLHYAATMDLQWYDPDAITTKDGSLEIEFEKFENHDLSYRSGMLQSWNKLCFKGGIIEARISLPGTDDVPGFWGAFWTMGNLGRPGYLASTEGLWPYSYNDKCDAGVAPNQTSSDGLSWLPGMKLPGCTCKGSDHPTPGTARGAPEIDALEASSELVKGKYQGKVSQSSQVAPFDKDYKPDYNYIEVYKNNITEINTYLGGNLQESVSGLSTIESDWFQDKGYQTYGFEYKPGTSGYVDFFVGDTQTIRIDAEATGARDGIGARPVSHEPMSIIFNIGMSPSFSEIDFTAIEKLLPGKLRVDWIRIYQDPDNVSVTCDPPGFETTQYIKDHPEPYSNVNLTRWDQTKYSWPKNTFVDKCSA